MSFVHLFYCLCIILSVCGYYFPFQVLRLAANDEGAFFTFASFTTISSVHIFANAHLFISYPAFSFISFPAGTPLIILPAIILADQMVFHYAFPMLNCYYIWQLSVF